MRPTQNARDWLTALALFAVALAMRIPSRGQYAYYWDSAQYALAIKHYDMRIGLPHRPGYFLYVMAGRLIDFFMSDPHVSLVWLSVAMGAALPAIGYLLGNSLFGGSCGIATAVILATSPLCWFSSEVALNNIVDAALVTATIWAAWSAIQRGGTWLDIIGLAVLLAIVAGVRQQTAPVLLPAWLYAFAKFQAPRLRKVMVGLVVMAAVSLLWFVPMIQMSGGLAVYVELLRQRARIDAPLTLWGGGSKALWENASIIIASCWAGLLAAGLLAAAAWVGCKRDWIAQHRRELSLLGWWIVPMVAFGIATFTYRPDYVLSYFPALALLAGAGIARAWTKSKPATTGLLLAITGIVNCCVFLGTGHLALGLPVTAKTLREHDRRFRTCIEAIRKHYRPSEVLICHANQYLDWGFRQFQYHLPEYDNWLLKTDPALASPYNRKLWHATGALIEFPDRFPPCNDKILLLIVPPKLDKTIFEALLPPNCQTEPILSP